MTSQSGSRPIAKALAAGTLLLGFCGPSAFASSGINLDCNEVTEELATPELPSPSLNVRVADHGTVDASADIAAPPAPLSAEEIPSPALTEDIELAEDVEASSADDKSASGPVSTPPETALRLPGVPEEEQPRFRRQMYRTDI